LARHGLTPAEFGVLEALLHRGPMLVGEVQRRVMVSSGGITYLVDRLETRGLVERRGHPLDRRARLAALTTEGETLVKRILPEHTARIKAALAPPSARRRSAKPSASCKRLVGQGEEM
jgi:MarR family 2-MHQ and catechol resistance regulon transcriptional repressor